MKRILTNSTHLSNLQIGKNVKGKEKEKGRESYAGASSSATIRTPRLEKTGEAGTDEKFDDEDDTLIVNTGGEPGQEGKLWLIKLPKYLLERWSAVDEDGRQLGTLRVWEKINPKTNKPYMSILTPSEKDPTQMEEYKLDVEPAVKDKYAFAVQEDEEEGDHVEEEERQGVKAPRMKKKFLVGAITSRGTVRPNVESESYSGRMKARYEEAAPKRKIKMVEDDQRANSSLGAAAFAGSVAIGGGWSKAKDSFNESIKNSKPFRKHGNPKDKFVRIPKNQVIDRLFDVFHEKERWSLNELWQRCEQPKDYLQQVLPDIAEKITSGKDHGKWVLKPSYKSTLNTSPVARGSQNQVGDEDDDMEEIY